MDNERCARRPPGDQLIISSTLQESDGTRMGTFQQLLGCTCPYIGEVTRVALSGICFFSIFPPSPVSRK
jgi:hypothetical protein